MKYSTEEKQKIINGKTVDLNVEEYCKRVGIGSSTYYKWLKDFRCNNNEFVDITKALNSSNSSLNIEVSGVNISVTSNYDESLLLRLVRTLNKL